jgi:hypothetical protein
VRAWGSQAAAVASHPGSFRAGLCTQPCYFTFYDIFIFFIDLYCLPLYTPAHSLAARLLPPVPDAVARDPIVTRRPPIRPQSAATELHRPCGATWQPELTFELLLNDDPLESDPTTNLSGVTITVTDVN